MKKSVTLGILLGVLVIMIGVYAVISSISEENPPDEGTPETVEYDVLKLNSETLTHISYNVGETVYGFTVREDSTGWTYNGDAEMPLYNTPFVNMMNAVGDLKSTICIEGVSEERMRDEYGIGAEKSVTVTFVDATNGEQTLRFGSTNEFNQKTYVATKKEAGKVYMVDADVVSVFAVTPADMVRDDTLPTVSAARLRSVRLLDAQGNIGFTRQSGADADDCWSRALNDGESEPISAEMGKGISDAICGLKLSGAVTFHTADRAEYGLDSGFAVLTVTYTVSTTVTDPATGGSTTADVEKTYELYVGNRTDDGSRYVRMPDGSGIYLVSLPETLFER